MFDTNNSMGYPVKPKGREMIGRCRNQMKLVDCSVESFLDGVSRGYAWMPGVMEGGMRRENWRSQQLIALDFDNKAAAIGEDGKLIRDETNRVVQRDLVPGDSGYISPYGAVWRLRDSGIAPMAFYTTYSSTPDHPKFRVVIMLDDPCEDPDVMELAIDRLLFLFPEADQSCKDLARLFFGTRGKSCLTGFSGLNWEPTDIRAILSLPPRPSAVSRATTARKAIPEEENRCGRKNVDLVALKSNADLLGMIQSDTGEVGHPVGAYVEFHKCPICGHNDCFRYYAHNNTWTCFSDSNASGRRGGSAIDYVMARDGLDVGKAIAVLASRERSGTPGLKPGA